MKDSSSCNRRRRLEAAETSYTILSSMHNSPPNKPTEHERMGESIQRRIICFKCSTYTNHQNALKLLLLLLSIIAGVALVANLSGSTTAALWGGDDPVNNNNTTNNNNACRVLVDNARVDYHAETLESIFTVFPLQYTSIPDASSRRDCNASHILFDYVIRRGPRHKSWAAYIHQKFHQRPQERVMIDNNDGVRRQFGRILYHNSHDTYTNYTDRHTLYNKYHAVVHATCYCTKKDGGKSKRPSGTISTSDDNNNNNNNNNNNTKESCIFHEDCPRLRQHPHAVFLSPYFQHSYLPSTLPPPWMLLSNNNNNEQRHKPTLCVTGSPDRRDYALVDDYLLSQHHHNNTHHNLLGGFVLRNIGGKSTLNVTNLQNIHKSGLYDQIQVPDFLDFHRILLQNCTGMLALITNTTSPDYYSGTGKRKLSGLMPILAAYEIPALLDETLFRVYKEWLPTNQTVYVTHRNNDKESFRGALEQFIHLLKERNLDVAAKEEEEKNNKKKKPTTKAKTITNAKTTTATKAITADKKKTTTTRNDTKTKPKAAAKTITTTESVTPISSSRSVECTKKGVVRFRDPNMNICHYVKKGGNFGDELGPVVVHALLRRHFQINNTSSSCVPRASVQTKSRQFSCLLTLGSIMHFVQAHDHVWATGINPFQQQKKAPKIPSNVTFYSLRGPLSVQYLTTNMSFPLQVPPGKKEFPMGDPGFLLPYLFPHEFPRRNSRPTGNNANRRCFIPHYHDKDSTMPQGAVKIDVTLSWRTVLRQLLRDCDWIASTSLHGLVTGDALGIPTMWFQFEGSKTGQTEGYFKYVDYLTSIGRPGQQLHPQSDLEKTKDGTQYGPVIDNEQYQAISERFAESFPYQLFEVVK